MTRMQRLLSMAHLKNVHLQQTLSYGHLRLVEPMAIGRVIIPWFKSKIALTVSMFYLAARLNVSCNLITAQDTQRKGLMD